jgi:glycosyltransferase involved in cell wall biosynthesis
MKIPFATNFAINSILRRSQLEEGDPLNIITFCTHERYEQNLSKTGNNFYSLKHGKTWNSEYGVQPENYHQVSKLYEHIDYDLVLCQDLNRYPVAREIADKYNLPLVILTHVLPDIRYDVDRQREQLNSLEADSFVFISGYNLEQWAKNDGWVIHHGLDLDFWDDCDAKKESKVLSVANLFPERDWCLGWDLWCDTVGFNRETGEAEIPLELVGNNTPYSKAASSIQALRKKYHEASIYFNSSIHSPVPMSLMEAMACGCAIVSTETCMIPELIEDGVNGYLSNDPETLRFRLDELIKNPDKAKEMGEAARKTIEGFSLERFTKDWNQHFYKVVSEYESILLKK